MSNILSISEDVSLALHTMTLLAGDPARRVSNTEAAQALGASEHTLAKVLQRLTKVGLLESCRGPHGGFLLAKPTDEITLLAIYEAVEGPLGPASCPLGNPICRGEECVFGGLVESVQRQFTDYLARTSLAQLATRVQLEARSSAD